VTPKHHTCDDVAGVPAPGGMEIFTTRLMLHGLLSGSYRRFVDGMGLRGDERVLDFGAGSGAAAGHLAKRLQAGGHLTCVDISPGWQRTWTSRSATCASWSCRRGATTSW
jgi:SAM-dependent methyltransferase